MRENDALSSAMARDRAGERGVFAGGALRWRFAARPRAGDSRDLPPLLIVQSFPVQIKS
jgi:hypothetical protein